MGDHDSGSPDTTSTEEVSPDMGIWAINPCLYYSVCFSMDWVQGATLDLCDAYLCCNHWYGPPKREVSPDCDDNKVAQTSVDIGPTEEDTCKDCKDVSPKRNAELKLAKCQFEIDVLIIDPELSSQVCKEDKLVKVSSFDVSSTGESEVAAEQAFTIETRKTKIVNPTLKEIAERYIAAQNEETRLRKQMEEGEKQDVIESLAIFEDDNLSDFEGDNSLRNNSRTSDISESSFRYQLKKEGSHDLESIESAEELTTELKDTTSKDSGFAEECSGKRKMVRLPISHDSELHLSAPAPEPIVQPSPRMNQRTGSLKLSEKKKSMMKRISFRGSKKDKGTFEGSEPETGASSNITIKKKKKKDVPPVILTGQQPSFILRGKRVEKRDYNNNSRESSCSSTQES